MKLAELYRTLGRKISVADQIAAGLRDLILSGDLRPGDRIVESRIAKQLGAGQPTVREALPALEYQGLVVRKANQGCVVTKLTRKEVEQILRIRLELEPLAAELAAEHGSAERIQALLDLAREMHQAALRFDLERFYRCDLRFHETLWELSGNAFLSRLLSQIMAPLLAFLFIRNMRNRSQVDLAASARAHVEIAGKILIGDKQSARESAGEHFQMFASQHLGWFEE